MSPKEIDPLEYVWVFNGEGGRFPSGVFLSKEKAEAWIGRVGLTGLLTKYPIDCGVYEWAVGRGVFRPKKVEQQSADFIQRFTSASLEHQHYANGSVED